MFVCEAARQQQESCRLNAKQEIDKARGVCCGGGTWRNRGPGHRDGRGAWIRPVMAGRFFLRHAVAGV